MADPSPSGAWSGLVALNTGVLRESGCTMCLSLRLGNSKKLLGLRCWGATRRGRLCTESWGLWHGCIGRVECRILDMGC